MKTCLDREELAWAAGFFDGEGSISLANRGKGGPLLFMGQVRKEPLNRFLNAVAGMGSINGPYDYSKRRGPNATPYYTWQTGKFEHVQAILAMLWCFLSEPKKEKAKQVLEEAKTHRHYRRKEGGSN